jgi:ABC-type polysaccharide/polyol phosphate transport system ATPase subunit
VSHEPYTIANFCQRAILIDGGRVVLDDRADRVADEYLRRLETAPVAVATTA